MSEAYLTNWSIGSDWTERADPFHETALADARVASEYRRFAPEAKAPTSLIARIRQAVAGPAVAECGTCTA
jgi:hypothetical protein